MLACAFFSDLREHNVNIRVNAAVKGTLGESTVKYFGSDNDYLILSNNKML